MQHEIASGYMGGENKLLDTQKKDKIKDKWCNKNGVNLFRISYKDLHRINDVLTNLLQNQYHAHSPNRDWVQY